MLLIFILLKILGRRIPAWQSGARSNIRKKGSHSGITAWAFPWVIIVLSVLATTTIGNVAAKDIEYIEKKTVSLPGISNMQGQWHVSVYETKDIDKWDYNSLDSKDMPVYICFYHGSDKKDQDCHPAMDTSGGPTYTFQFFEDLKILQLRRADKPRMGVFFIARNEGYHLGFAMRILRLISIWTYNEEAGRFKEAFHLTLTEQGEFQYAFPRSEELDGVVVGADFIWGESDQGRYAEHRYAISIYQLVDSGIYKWVGTYKTQSKYESLADSNASVIDQELSNIEKYVRENTAHQ